MSSKALKYIMMNGITNNHYLFYTKLILLMLNDWAHVEGWSGHSQFSEKNPQTFEKELETFFLCPRRLTTLKEKILTQAFKCHALEI